MNAIKHHPKFIQHSKRKRYNKNNRLFFPHTSSVHIVEMCKSLEEIILESTEKRCLICYIVSCAIV